MAQTRYNVSAASCADSDLLVLEEFCQFMSITKPHSCNDYGIYPHQSYTRSGLITLKDKSSLDSEKSLLLKVIEESLRVEFSASNAFKCVLILNDGQIRSFHFHDENDYWRFVFGLKSIHNLDFDLEGDCNFVVEKTMNTGNGSNDQQTHKSRFLFYHSSQTADASGWKFKFSNGGVEVSKATGKVDASLVRIIADEIIGATISHDFSLSILPSHLFLLRLPAVGMMSNMISRYVADLVSSSTSGSPFSHSIQPCVECSSEEVIVFPLPVSLDDVYSLQQAVSCQLKIRETFAGDKTPGDIQDNSKVLITANLSFNIWGKQHVVTDATTAEYVKWLNHVPETAAMFEKLNTLDKLCLFRHPIGFEAMQTPKLHNKALRVFIKSASSLPQTKSAVPNAYCTVYLVGHNGDRLTSNHAEVRTATVKNVDPVWEKEILLQDNDFGVNQVQSVMILIRDASSGILKHHHIGQATIPISCFLEGVEAQFCLPLEPSYRMDSTLAEKAFIGEIHVTTQIVDVEQSSDKPANATNAPTDRSDRKALWSSKSDGKESSKAPLKLSTDNKTMLLNCSHTLYRCSPFTTWYPCRNIVSGIKGFICLMYDHLVVRYGHKQDDNATDVRIPFEHVEKIVEASATVLLASASIVNGIGLHQRMLLMIGPCVSKDFRMAIKLRSYYYKVKANVEKMVVQLSEEDALANNKSMPRSPKGKLERRPSSPSGKFHKPNDFSSSSMIPLKSLLMAAASYLEERCCTISSDWGVATNLIIFSWEKSFLSFIYKTLITLCVKHEVFSNPWRLDEVAVDKVVSEWQQQLSEGYFDFNSSWCEQIRDTLLHLISTVRTSILSCDYSNQNSLIKAKLSHQQRKYIQDNVIAMQKALHGLCATKSDFDKLENLVFKDALLRVIVQNNTLLNQRYKIMLSLSGWEEETDDWTLIHHTDNLMDWFKRGIAADVKKWIGKTLYAVQHLRENKMNFPWDIDLMGNFVTSSIPESFQMQLDVYEVFLFRNEWVTESMALHYYSQEMLDHLRIQFSSHNKDLRAILGNAWILLLHEYNRALSSRHWDESKDSIEQRGFTEFLCSIINDAHRIKKLSVARDPDNSYIQSEIDRMKQLAVTCLVKVIFSATQETILSMNESWFDESSSVAQVLCHNIGNYSKQVRSICWEGAVDAVLVECFTVITMRYLIMFREKLGSKLCVSFDAEDIQRLQRDMEMFRTLATDQCSDGEIPTSLAFLINFVQLITEDPTGPLFNTSLLWIMRQYDMSDREQLVFIELLVLHCALPLRHDADEDAYRAILSIFDSHGDLEKYTLHIGLDVVTNDPYYRCFGRLLSHWSGASTSANNNSTNSTTVLSQLGKLKQMQPKAALKMLREKTSDLMLSSAFGGVAFASQRQNEGYALALLRDIGLEKERNEIKRGKVPMNDAVLKYFGEMTTMDEDKEKPSIARLLDGLTDTKNRKNDTVGRGRRLEISEVHVRGLHSFSVIGEANPYVYFEVGEEKVKTSVKWNHKEAEWDETFSLQISTEQLADENLVVEVYDKERIRRKRLLGTVAVKLHSLLSCSGGSWYALEGGEKSSCGEVYLHLVIK